MTISLTMMENTVRRMTARYTEAQMTTAQIDGYINQFMTLFLPLHFKNLKLTKSFTFTTIPNVDTYQFVYENGITTGPGGQTIPGSIQPTPPVYCQGYILRYFQDKTTFYNRWPNLSVNQIVGNGGLGAGPYVGTIPSTPFYRAQLDIFGNVTEPGVIISAYDNNGFSLAITDIPTSGNSGNLIDPEGRSIGEIDYITGDYTFELNSPQTIPADAQIFAAVVPYQSSRPTDILFYNQQFVLRPCPQQVYLIEFQISQQPLSLIGANSNPELDEWYLFICAGASKLIYTDFPDPEGMAAVEVVFQEHLQIAQRRSLRQLSSQRAQTIFSQPTRPLASWFWGTEYSGSV